VKTLPKSLHTVTVLVNVARHLQRTNNETRHSAVTSAMILLGYSYTDTADPYGLAARAVKELSK
jgi:hypothetical protein